MNGKIAKKLRKEANNMYDNAPEKVQKKTSRRRIYQWLKNQFKKGK